MAESTAIGYMQAKLNHHNEEIHHIITLLEQRAETSQEPDDYLHVMVYHTNAITQKRFK